MRDNVKYRLSLAAVFGFLISTGFILSGASAAAGSALNSLTAASDGVHEIAQLPAVLPAAVPVFNREQALVAVLKPGKDLLPVLHDSARVKAVLQLITDIYNGVHLPYSQDGATFTNREGRLPAQPMGFYKEYTLLTGSAPHTVTIGETTYQVAPDLSARGSERLIIGGGEKIYYTPDHYAKFVQFTMVY